MPPPTVHRRRYTLSEVQSKVLDGQHKLDGSSQDASKDRWAGASWEESLDLLLNGWKKGVAKLNVKPLSALHEAVRPQPTWDVAGSEVDMGLYLSGVPECMIETVRRKRPAQVVRIGVDKAISCQASAARIQNMGRNIVLLVEGLRLAGIPAEVWVCQAIFARPRDFGAKREVFDLGICVQQPGRPVDVSMLAYWVAHPAALRRTIFALEELEPAHIRKTFGFEDSRGYGFPLSNHAEQEFDEWAPSPERPDYVIMQWVEDVLNRRAGR